MTNEELYQQYYNTQHNDPQLLSFIAELPKNHRFELIYLLEKTIKYGFMKGIEAKEKDLKQNYTSDRSV